MKNKSRADMLLEIIAMSGEFPTQKINRIIPSQNYGRKIVAELVRLKLIRCYKKNNLKGYRLTSKGKQKLLGENKERFSCFLVGKSETNQVNGTIERRLRLHSMAETFVTMINAGVFVFHDEKQIIFGLIADENKCSLAIQNPTFYSSREYKNEGVESNKIRGSRATGVLLTKSNVYVVYNTGDGVMRWSQRTEMRVKAEMQDYICHKVLANQYGSRRVECLMLGTDIDVLEKILTCKNQKLNTRQLISQSYEHIYFLTNDKYGEAQLKLLCEPKRKQYLDTSLLKDLAPVDPKYLIENDGFDKDGNPVLLMYIPDLPRLARFQAALALQNRYGVIICFDYQKRVMENYFGKTATIQTIDFTKFERRFLSR